MRRNDEITGSVVRSVDTCLAHTGVIEGIAAIKKTLGYLLALHGIMLGAMAAFILKGCS